MRRSAVTIWTPAPPRSIVRSNFRRYVDRGGVVMGGERSCHLYAEPSVVIFAVCRSSAIRIPGLAEVSFHPLVKSAAKSRLLRPASYDRDCGLIMVTRVPLTFAIAFVSVS